VILIDLSININDSLLLYDDQRSITIGGESRVWKCVLLTFSFLGFGFGFCFLFMTFNLSHSLIFPLMTSILVCIFTMVQLFNTGACGTLLTSSVVAAYISYLTAHSMSTTLNSSSWVDFNAIGIMISMISLLSLCFGVDSSQSSSLSNEQAIKYGAVEHEPRNLSPPFERSQVVMFNVWMVLISSSWAMNLTSWNCKDNCESVLHWPYVISAWMSALVYLWILVAPQLFPDRSFS